jgi:hypothetical protein
LGLFRATFISSNLFGNLCSSILLISLNHLNLFPLIWFYIFSMLSSSLTCAFRILFLSVFPIISLRISPNLLVFCLLSFSACLCQYSVYIFIMFSLLSGRIV